MHCRSRDITQEVYREVPDVRCLVKDATINLLFGLLQRLHIQATCAPKAVRSNRKCKPGMHCPEKKRRQFTQHLHGLVTLRVKVGLESAVGFVPSTNIYTQKYIRGPDGPDYDKKASPISTIHPKSAAISVPYTQKVQLRGAGTDGCVDRHKVGSDPLFGHKPLDEKARHLQGIRICSLRLLCTSKSQPKTRTGNHAWLDVGSVGVAVVVFAEHVSRNLRSAYRKRALCFKV